MNISIMTAIRKIYPTNTSTISKRQQSLLDKIKADGSITIAEAIKFTNGTYKMVRGDLALLKSRELVSSERIGARSVFSSLI